MEASELVKYVHSVIGDVVVFEREAAAFLEEAGVEYREWGNLLKVKISDLEEKGIPRSELEKYKVKKLETSKKLIDSSEQRGPKTQSINYLIINSSETQRIPSQKSSRKLIDSIVILNTILKSINDSHVKSLIAAAREMPKRKITSLYIDVMLWDEFLKELAAWGIPQKKTHVIIEGLIAKFIEESRKLRLQNEG